MLQRGPARLQLISLSVPVRKELEIVVLHHEPGDTGRQLRRPTVRPAETDSF